MYVKSIIKIQNCIQLYYRIPILCFVWYFNNVIPTFLSSFYYCCNIITISTYYFWTEIYWNSVFFLFLVYKKYVSIFSIQYNMYNLNQKLTWAYESTVLYIPFFNKPALDAFIDSNKIYTLYIILIHAEHGDTESFDFFWLTVKTY